MRKAKQIITAVSLACVAIAHIHCAETKQKRMPTPIEMPAPADDWGNIYAHGMSAILSHLGTEISYDRVMGLTGVAFILQVNTSGPFVEGMLDCAWWPNDDWGFELGLPVLAKAVGRELSRLGCDIEEYRADPAAVYRRVFAAEVEKSLRDGKPVLAYGFVGTELDDQEPPLLGYGTSGKSTKYSQEKVRVDRYPWLQYLVGDKTQPANEVEVDLASLRHIVALYNEKAQRPDAPGTRFSGRQAWEAWLRLLRNGVGCDNNMLVHLRHGRGSAVPYLREMAGRYSGKIAEHLRSAADLYQQSLDDLYKQEMPYGSLVKGAEEARATRESYTTMVERVFKLEAQAIAELEAAAASISDKP